MGCANVRFPQISEATSSRAKLTIDMRSTGLFTVMCVLVFVSLALLHRGTEPVKWPLVQGNIQDTRIVIDHAVETKWGGELTWKAEYRIVYFAASRQYTLWADSGIRSESEAGVRLALSQSHPSCRLQYNPKRPEETIANCH